MISLMACSPGQSEKTEMQVYLLNRPNDIGGRDREGPFSASSSAWGVLVCVCVT